VVDDDPAPVADWLPYLAEVLGVKPPLRLPAWLGRLLAGEFVVAQMTGSRGYSNEKARKELGWEPRYPSWREGFHAWARGWREGLRAWARGWREGLRAWARG
jgi:nucleoside-diphosphate-sugar epimerase